MNNKEHSSRQKEIRNLRIQKIKNLESLGLSAYLNPKDTKPTHTLKEVVDNFAKFKRQKKDKKYKLVGRIMIKRGAGKIAFVKFFDGTEYFQAVLQADVLGKKKMKIFDKNFDMGDFVIFQGTLFKTKKGEKSLKVTSFKMAGKSILPLPEKWHGITDIEEKYRKRYLDVLSDQNAFDKFKKRSEVIREIRNFMDNEGFLEIETPILQNQASGAMAETFNTHHNDYNLDMVLRISLEAEHKIVMAGGYPAVYEIGKNFRNEGSDSTHIQEFTMIEWYKAYRGLDYNIKLTEKLLKHLAKKVIKKTVFEIKDENDKKVKVDFSKEWKKVKFNDLIKKYAKIDVQKATRKELEKKAMELGGVKKEILKMSHGNLLDFIYKKSARKKLINPTFVLNYPGSLKPLAIQNEDGTSEVAQLVIGGAEVTNQYAELVNPLVQRKLLEDQLKAKKSGDKEAMDFNSDFLEAMEYGMPPMTGFGMGIDRLMAIFTEQDNLRDTILFPIIKPK
ncbi:lysine--tRNA ligase [Candidatus Campbellbacteria bacterium]|nr:MAG: lysine--tRNA ligase [Candidatus Campbellbacteria bacterium]